MKIECLYDALVDVSKIKAHPKNPNKHDRDQIERLAKILDYQGWRYPVKVSKLTGFVTSGHGRIEAAKKNGWKQIPVNYQAYENEDQEYADVVSDNAIADWSVLDLAQINFDIPALGPDFNIEFLGIKDFVVEPADKIEPQTDEDSIPEKVEPRSKLGDIYQLGRHRLMCGDSTSIDAVERLMDGKKADMVFTDPPYGMRLDADYSWADNKSFDGLNSRSIESKKYQNVIGDHEDFKPELIQTALGAFSYCKEVFLFGADYYAELIPEKNSGSWIVWDKRGNESADKGFGSTFELAWSKQKHKRDIARIQWFGTFGVSDDLAKKRVHPTQKPVQLAEWFFERWGGSGDLVADLFGGSGSTLIACEKTNRTCFMMELDPKYCDVIVARWEKYTGETAEQIITI